MTLEQVSVTLKISPVLPLGLHVAIYVKLQVLTLLNLMKHHSENASHLSVSQSGRQEMYSGTLPRASKTDYRRKKDLCYLLCGERPLHPFLRILTFADMTQPETPLPK